MWSIYPEVSSSVATVCMLTVCKLLGAEASPLKKTLFFPSVKHTSISVHRKTGRNGRIYNCLTFLLHKDPTQLVKQKNPNTQAAAWDTDLAPAGRGSCPAFPCRWEEAVLSAYRGASWLPGFLSPCRPQRLASERKEWLLGKQKTHTQNK